MLAVSRPVPMGVGWALEPKLDGFRAVSELIDACVR